MSEIPQPMQVRWVQADGTVVVDPQPEAPYDARRFQYYQSDGNPMGRATGYITGILKGEDVKKMRDQWESAQKKLAKAQEERIKAQQEMMKRLQQEHEARVQAFMSKVTFVEGDPWPEDMLQVFEYQGRRCVVITVPKTWTVVHVQSAEEVADAVYEALKAA